MTAFSPRITGRARALPFRDSARPSAVGASSIGCVALVEIPTTTWEEQLREESEHDRQRSAEGVALQEHVLGVDFFACSLRKSSPRAPERECTCLLQ
jgi:hypothetical protein